MNAFQRFNNKIYHFFKGIQDQTEHDVKEYLKKLSVSELEHIRDNNESAAKRRLAEEELERRGY